MQVIKIFRFLPKTEEARIIGKQLLRSSTSVATNYRAACRARSHAEFISKIGVVVEEADETVFWMELLIEGSIFDTKDLHEALTEAKELLAIFASSQITAKFGKKPNVFNDPMNQSYNAAIL